MNRTAIVFNSFTLYWYSVVISLAIAAGGCFFLACCHHRRISFHRAWGALLVAILLSVPLSRFVFWYCRPFGFQSFLSAMTEPASINHALLGAFMGCAISTLIFSGSVRGIPKLLDCMSVAGCGAIALGRFGYFFTDADRGQIVSNLTHLPWSYPIENATSGALEYRFATFMFQAIIALILFIALMILFFSPRIERLAKEGDLTLLFLLVYGCSQVLLDSTRYDALYLRSNGFVSMIQIIAAIAFGTSIVLFSRKAVKSVGRKKWMVPAWGAILALIGGAGYMEYYVQRHGRLALFSYSIMGLCLVGIVALGILFWITSIQDKKAE